MRARRDPTAEGSAATDGLAWQLLLLFFSLMPASVLFVISSGSAWDTAAGSRAGWSVYRENELEVGS